MMLKTGPLIVKLYALSLVLELTSFALIVKLEVVFEETAFASVPEITYPELVEVKDIPEGKEPDSNVYVTSPPDSDPQLQL